ncbi:protein phosphatase 1J-like [Urocitellus parryii]
MEEGLGLREAGPQPREGPRSTRLKLVRSAVAHLVSSGGASPLRTKSPDLPSMTSAPLAAATETPKSPPARPGSESWASAKTVEAPASFSRPTFLQLSPGGLRCADDHACWAVQSPPDRGRRLPWSTGYTDVINTGKRWHNEDQVCCEVYVEGWRGVTGAPREPSQSPGLCFYYWGLFDGHGSGGAAKMASWLLHRHIQEQLKDLVETLQDHSPPPLCLPCTSGTPGSSDSTHLIGPQSCWSSQKEVTHESLVVGAIENAFQLMVSEQMAREQECLGHQVEGGCCALVVVYLLGKVYVANAGDSRAIIVRNGEIIPMFPEFTPETERQHLQLLGFLKPELLGGEFTHLEFPCRAQPKELGQRMLYWDQNITGCSGSSQRLSFQPLTQPGTGAPNPRRSGGDPWPPGAGPEASRAKG